MDASHHQASIHSLITVESTATAVCEIWQARYAFACLVLLACALLAAVNLELGLGSSGMTWIASSTPTNFGNAITALMPDPVIVMPARHIDTGGFRKAIDIAMQTGSAAPAPSRQ